MVHPRGAEMADVLENKIQELLDKRNELAGRLGSLEDLKSQTNERVYARIKKDYQSQLQEVLTEIAGERGALEEKASSLKGEIDKHEQLHQQQSDTVDELNLRAMLKEFDENDNSFRDELAQATSQRDQTAESLEAFRSELADLNKVLKDVQAATTEEPPSIDEDVEELDLGEEEILEEDILEEDITEEEAEEGAGVTCPSCGHTNPPQKLFCENCGSALDEEGDLDEEFDLLDEELDSI